MFPRTYLLSALLLLAAPAAPSTILVVGDSLSAEYGLARDTGWVHLLADRVTTRAPQYSVVNASISGDTTSGGRSRIGALLRRNQPQIVVIELGANDGLRGLSVEAMRANLEAMVDACHAQDARVLLVGMRLPPNYGPAYVERFAAAYTAVAREKRVSLVPFLLDGFAEHVELFQPDRLHPLAQAEPRVLENVWPVLEPMLRATPR